MATVRVEALDANGVQVADVELVLTIGTAAPAKVTAGDAVELPAGTQSVGLGATQRPGASFGFDELDGLLVGHRLATIFTMCASQRGGEPESNDFAVHYGGRIHALKLSEKVVRNKRRIFVVGPR